MNNKVQMDKKYLELQEQHFAIKVKVEMKYWDIKWHQFTHLMLLVLPLLLLVMLMGYLLGSTRALYTLDYITIASTNISAGRVISCYYNTPSSGGQDQLLPVDINPQLCTHINVAFARVVNKKVTLDDIQLQALTDIVKLKEQNPKLYILLSVGGAGDDRGFSDMVVDHASRKIFIRSIRDILRNYTLDGIDLDWEFPAMSKRFTGGHERQHFSQLLREIRAEYIREHRNYLLTVAVAAPEPIVSVSYDIEQLNLYTDFVNIMTYDYHSFTKYTPFTGLNSPLYPRPNEQLYLATLNINYTVDMYINKGLDKNKIVVGIPTYGHTFTLVNADNTKVGSPASGFGLLGSLGFVNYPDVCNYLEKYKEEVIVEQDKDARVAYLHRDKEWVSYETPASVAQKAQYIGQRGLRGAMLYSLNADDYRGSCPTGRGEPFPLARTVSHSLLGDTSTGITTT